MFDVQTALSVLAACLHGTGFVKYNLQAKEGSSKPNFASWFVWAVMATLNALTFSAATSWINALTTFVGSAGCIGTFGYAFATGKFDWPGWRERVELAISLAAVLVWWFWAPLYANLILLPAFMISMEPTARGVWNDPGKERKLAPWVLWTTAYAITALTTYLYQGGWTLKLVSPAVVTAMHGLVPAIRLTRK